LRALTLPESGGVDRPSASASWSLITAGRLAERGTGLLGAELLNISTV